MKLKTQHLKSIPKNAVMVGAGILTWCRGERVSDRYGTVYLHESGSEAPAELFVPSGHGTLIAEVLEAHPSSHIGDLARGLRPRTPEPGDIIVLGTGAAFTEQQEGLRVIGVRPADSRPSDWLNPRALYDVHSSRVRLIWSATPNPHERCPHCGREECECCDADVAADLGAKG